LHHGVSTHSVVPQMKQHSDRPMRYTLYAFTLPILCTEHMMNKQKDTAPL